MTEQEIIECLKNNHKNGIALGFLPDEVRQWVYINPISIFRFFDGKEWIKSKNIVIRDNDIICLLDNYELKNLEKTGEWVEIELKDGKFYDIQQGLFYSWYEWLKIMSVHPSFTHFGGYYYGIEPIPRWYMTECVAPTDCNGSIYTSYTDGDKNIKPLTPKKIRFWRENK